jgi:hypothetical protein
LSIVVSTCSPPIRPVAPHHCFHRSRSPIHRLQREPRVVVTLSRRRDRFGQL